MCELSKTIIFLPSLRDGNRNCVFAHFVWLSVRDSVGPDPKITRRLLGTRQQHKKRSMMGRLGSSVS